MDKQDDDVSLHDMVQALQEAEIGDAGRLEYIMNRIKAGRSIYDTDRRYVQKQFSELRTEPSDAREEPSDAREEPSDAREEPSDAREEPSARITESTPESAMQDVAPPSAKKKPGKAWYGLSIFLGILGGIIAFAALRKRDRGMAYKNLAVGIGVTLILPAILMAGMMSDDFSFEREPEYADVDIKRQAVSIPYQFLMDNPDIHEGEIVQYDGVILQVQEELFGTYLLRVGLDAERFGASDPVAVKYEPVTDEESEWLERLENDLTPFTEDREFVTFWGISDGVEEFTTVFGQTVKLPKIDAIIIARQTAGVQSETPHADPEPQSLPSDTSTRHTVSFSDIPEYVDDGVVERAVIDAVREWDMANAHVAFVVTESDADVNISWARYMPGSSLGLHSASVTNAGDRENHSITVRLGIDDCHSEYAQFSHDALQYTIAHEIGHYLGLRHIDDRNHLMYSGELFNVDAARVYDDLGLGIPDLQKPDIATVAGLGIQSQIDSLNADLDQISMQRQELKDSEEVLDDNTVRHNVITSQIQELEDELSCVNLP